MITFQDFMSLCEAAYDKEVMSGSQIRTMGTGGRISSERKKSKPEIRRFRSVKDPKTGKVIRVPVNYKARKDIGQQKTAAERQQQPEHERGSAEVKQSYAEKIKAERRAAARARAAAKKSGEQPSSQPESKPKAKDIESQATKLLSKKAEAKPKAPAKDPRFSSSRDPEDHMIKGSLLPKGEPKRPYTREEKKKIVRTGKRLQADLQKGREKPASEYKL